MTRILFGIAGDETKGSTRFRILNQLDYFEESDIEYTIVSLPRGPSSREKIQFVSKILWYGLSSDIILIQRIKLPSKFIRFLTRFYSPVVYDFDDAIYTQPSWKTEEIGDVDKFDEMLSTVSTVVAGSPALAQYARQYSDDVYPLLTPIPRENHEHIDHGENGKSQLDG